MTKMGLYMWAFKILGLPNFGGLKPLLKWFYAWAGPGCGVCKENRWKTRGVRSH